MLNRKVKDYYKLMQPYKTFLITIQSHDALVESEVDLMSGGGDPLVMGGVGGRCHGSGVLPSHLPPTAPAPPPGLWPAGPRHPAPGATEPHYMAHLGNLQGPSATTKSRWKVFPNVRTLRHIVKSNKTK